jgi:hypothetical protein
MRRNDETSIGIGIAIPEAGKSLLIKGTTIKCEEIGSTNTCFGYVDLKTYLVSLI